MNVAFTFRTRYGTARNVLHVTKEHVSCSGGSCITPALPLVDSRVLSLALTMLLAYMHSNTARFQVRKRLEILLTSLSFARFRTHLSCLQNWSEKFPQINCMDFELVT